jgi:hypothetical protein
MGAVADDLNPQSVAYPEETLLYTALTARVRKGPYMEGASGSAIAVKDGDKEFSVFPDGWGRPIEYRKVPIGSENQKPELVSGGPDGEIGTGDDDITNYD